MNKNILALILLAFITINETLPFLHNDAYTIKDINWGWVIAYPLMLLLANKFMNKKE